MSTETGQLHIKWPSWCALDKILWRISRDYRELKQALGLDHFEGCTLTGWHPDVTLVAAAHLCATTLRGDPDPKAPGAA